MESVLISFVCRHFQHHIESLCLDKNRHGNVPFLNKRYSGLMVSDEYSLFWGCLSVESPNEAINGIDGTVGVFKIVIQ
jgi:hypothetical protein